MTKQSRLSKFRLSIALFALLGAVALLSACNKADQEAALRRAIVTNCDYDINGFILDKLQNNRVVMLADSWHGHPLPRETLSNFLNHWIDLLDRADSFDVSIPAKLFLVLETDSSGLERFNSFARTDDASELFSHSNITFAVIGPHLTVEEIEYQHDLAAIKRRVAEHNTRATSTSSLDKYVSGKASRNNEIAFEIVGPERSIDLNNSSFGRRDSFFIWERDEYSSGRVSAMLEEHPDYVALVFYGAAHLNRNLAHKNTTESSSRPGPQGDGYFLAHYLTEQFADKGGVYTIGQMWATQLNRFSYLAPGRTYALDNSALENAGIALDDPLVLSEIDGNVMHFGTAESPTPITNVWSKHLVDAMIPTLSEVTEMRNDFFRAIHSTIYRYLETYTSIVGAPSERNFNDSACVARMRANWIEWWRRARLDVVADLDTCGPALRSIGLLERIDSLQEKACEYYATSVLGRYAPIVDSSYTVGEKARLCREYLEANKDAFVTDNLVNLLLVGTPEEQAQAKVVLRRRTGQSFASAKEWMVWWRENRPTVEE